MKTLPFIFVFLAAALTARAYNITGSSTTTRTITVTGTAYDLNFDINWACDDYPQLGVQGKIELLDSSGTRVAAVWASVYRSSGPYLFTIGPGSTSNVNYYMAVYSADGSPADGDLTFTWNLTGLAPGTYTLRLWNYTSYDSLLHATTVWTSPMFLGGSAPPPTNVPPTIAWTSTTTTAGSGQTYTISAHGNDADGNLTQVNIWKNGAPFAFAGGGNGTDSDSSNPSTDTGPQTVTFTAQAVDGAGATSALITQVVTITAAPPVQYSLATLAGAGGSVSPGGIFASGASATVTASPDAAHDFSGWSGDASGIANPYGIVMDRDKTVQANFVLKSYLLTTSAANGGSVTPGGSYPLGTIVTITATTDATHYFIGWAGDASGTAPSVAVTVDRAKAVQALFAAMNAQTITFNPPGDHPLGSPAFALAATASSGLRVTFAIVSGPATIAGNSVQVTGPGTVIVQASQAGDPFTLAAPAVTQSFNVTAPAVTKYRAAARTLLQSGQSTAAVPYVLQP